jgi:alkylation response protein AidB-like acyl-CoA dehydrogenase
MAYGLSEEQENMLALAREFAKEKMLPHAAVWEEDKARSNRL